MLLDSAQGTLHKEPFAGTGQKSTPCTWNKLGKTQ